MSWDMLGPDTTLPGESSTGAGASSNWFRNQFEPRATALPMCLSPAWNLCPCVVHIRALDCRSPGPDMRLERLDEAAAVRAEFQGGVVTPTSFRRGGRDVPIVRVNA